jgi:hypothetical protein
MRTLSTVHELLPDYKTIVQALRSEGLLTIERGFDLVVTCYREVRIGAALPGDDSEEDMLLFQYGTNSWADGRGDYFGLDITRQLLVEEDEEQLVYQLSLEYEFDPLPFAACKPYNSWSTTMPALGDWVRRQKATVGYLLAQSVVFRDLKIGIQQV